MSGIDKVFDPSVEGIQKSMDLFLQRHEAITSNLANVETPGYRATDVDFGTQLNDAFKLAQPGASTEVARTNAKHFDLGSEGQSHLVADQSGVTRADGNNVDLDIQMGKMMFNSGKYSAASAIIRKKLRMMKMAIRFAQR